MAKKAQKAQRPRTKKQRAAKTYTSSDGQAAASKFGQMIGDAFADVVYKYIQLYLSRAYPGYVLLEPELGKILVKLAMPGGTSRQLDNVISQVNSIDPVALFESKWLKDGRHHNDKGAWILQLKEISRHYPTVRGAVANLSGYWTEGVRMMFESEGRVNMVLVATDEEVYSTLQSAIDAHVASNQLDPLKLDDMRAIRDKLPRAWDLANCLVTLKASGTLAQIATSWLNFERTKNIEGKTILGKHLIEAAIDKLLRPLPEIPQIVSFEISLQVDSGNVIYRRFEDLEEAFDFIERYTGQPQAILEIITPRPKESSTVQLELSLADQETNDDENNKTTYN
jgi:hypothetical protein